MPEERWLHQELDYIRRQAQVYRGRFNFVVLAEEASKRFGHPFHRATIRSFALRHRYYQARPEKKEKVFACPEAEGLEFINRDILPVIKLLWQSFQNRSFMC
ncbi:MAG: hypothetical protein ACP5J6_02485 [Candidatus Saccharicenans sp.]